jgi:transposase-like protein
MAKVLVTDDPGYEEASGRKSYTHEEKMAAVRLITEDGYTAQQAADKVGCSLASITNWKRDFKEAQMVSTIKQEGRAAAEKRIADEEAATKRVTKKSAKKGTRKGTKKGAKRVTKSGRPSLTDFVQGYWDSRAKAAEANGASQDISFREIPKITDALQYAYQKLE